MALSRRQSARGTAAIIRTLVASPPNFVINSPATIAFSIRIDTPTLNPTTVVLQRVDAQGNVLSTVGRMYDNGGGGDPIANDRRFTAQVPITETAVGRLHFRVTAAFRGNTPNATSASIFVDADPFPLPPDPGDQGKTTLEGIDLDNDGVRDDLQRWASLVYISDRESRLALLQIAKGAQQFIQASSPNQAAIADDVRSRAKDCMESFVGPYNLAELNKRMTLELLNTAERSAAYARASKSLGSRIYTLTSEPQLRSACEF
jgi:hypothetical protein